MSKKKDHIIVIRRNKGHKHAHHGGSWKIAYADFMTAMMAFFLVLWLLSSSTPLQRHQIAEYFKMPLSVALSNGDKASLSSSPIPGGGEDAIRTDGEVSKKDLKKTDRNKDRQNLMRARNKLESVIKSDPRLSNFQSNLRLSLTDDGLLIQIIDSQDRPMFKIGSKVLEPYMQGILQALVPVLNELPNRISLTGHTDSLPYASGDLGYSNWELSADRANASRRALIAGGMLGSKFIRIVGTADTMGVVNTSGDHPINRRISILVLTEEREKQILQEDTILNAMTDAASSEPLKSSLNVTPAPADAAPVPSTPETATQQVGENNGLK